MESSHLQITPRTKELLDRTYPHGYEVIHGHSYDSNCVGWLAYRLKPDVFRHDDEEFEPRKLFDKNSPSWFQYLKEIEISGLGESDIEEINEKLEPMQILGLVTESGQLVHVLLYDPDNDTQMPFESKQQGSNGFGGNNPPTRNVSLYDQVINMEKVAKEKITHIETYRLKGPEDYR